MHVVASASRNRDRGAASARNRHGRDADPRCGSRAAGGATSRLTPWCVACRRSVAARDASIPRTPCSSVPVSSSTAPRARRRLEPVDADGRGGAGRRRRRRAPACPRPTRFGVVNVLSWRYGNPALVVAKRLGIAADELAVTTTRRQQPAGARQRDRARDRRRASSTSPSSPAARLAHADAGPQGRRDPRLAEGPPDDVPTSLGDDLDMNHPAEVERGITMPVQVYPMFETASGPPPARRRRALARHQPSCGRGSARSPPTTRTRGSARPVAPSEIATVTPRNRMIGCPYRST